MANLLAAMIEFDNVSDFDGVTAAGYDAFDNALSRAQALFTTHAQAGDIKVFLAPEYYFSGHGITAGGATTVDSLSRTDKHGIYKKISASSKMYNDILIVPGSIAYSKARGLSSRKYYNVCPIAFNGQIIHKQYKKSNDSFQTGGDDFKSKNTGSTFNHKNKTFGIDICLDHGKSVLKDSLAGATVDVHILIADGAGPKNNRLGIDINGLVVYCNMNPSANGVKTVETNKYGNFDIKANATLASIAQPVVGAGKVVLYSAPIA